jgi:Histidine kinase-, DNA gyrase B-, and HSP90-like ATPase
VVPKPNNLHIYTNTTKKPATQRCCTETSCSSNVGKDIENTGKEIVWLQYEVYDTGIGIPGLDFIPLFFIIFLSILEKKYDSVLCFCTFTEKAIPTLFKRYMQASADHARKYGGTGLGLAICKQLVSD